MSFIMFLAAAPAIALVIYIYKKDRVEKEPVGLLVKLMFFGALSIIFAVIAELIAGKIFGFVFTEGTMLHAFIDNFFGVALIEEAGKYFALKWGSWKHPAFDFRFDGVVYGVCTSLGFALFENIFYVLDGGSFTALSRAVTAVPAHAIFGVFMGIAYGRAKHFANYGDVKNTKKYLRRALVIPTIIHGFYDFCLSVGSTMAILTFLIFLIAMYIVAFQTVKKAALEDIPVTGIRYNGGAVNDEWEKDY